MLRSDEAKARLQAAAARFKEALALADISGEERQAIEAWYVACLANVPDSVDLAQAELLRLIDGEPKNHRLLVWATARYPHLKMDKAVQALRAIVIDGKASPEQVAALVHRYAMTRQWKKAWDLLVRTKDSFAKAGALSIWSLSAAQVSAFMGKPSDAMKLAEDGSLSEAELRLVKSKILRLKTSAKARHDLLTHLEDSHAETKDPRFLLEAVETQAQAGEWVYVAERADALYSAIPAAEVLRLCAYGAYRAQRFGLCLRLLSDNLGIFPNSRLPADSVASVSSASINSAQFQWRSMRHHGWQPRTPQLRMSSR